MLLIWSSLLLAPRWVKLWQYKGQIDSLLSCINPATTSSEEWKVRQVCNYFLLQVERSCLVHWVVCRGCQSGCWQGSQLPVLSGNILIIIIRESGGLSWRLSLVMLQWVADCAGLWPPLEVRPLPDQPALPLLPPRPPHSGQAGLQSGGPRLPPQPPPGCSHPGKPHQPRPGLGSWPRPAPVLQVRRGNWLTDWPSVFPAGHCGQFVSVTAWCPLPIRWLSQVSQTSPLAPTSEKICCGKKIALREFLNVRGMDFPSLGCLNNLSV